MNKITIGLIAVGFVTISVVGPLVYRYYVAPFRGAVEQQETVQSGGSRIYNYERFYNLCSNVQTYEDQIDIQRDLLNETTNDEERSMILRNISGLNAQRQSAINTYNAEARMLDTGGQFRADDLPTSIPRNTYDGSTQTVCQ